MPELSMDQREKRKMRDYESVGQDPALVAYIVTTSTGVFRADRGTFEDAEKVRVLVDEIEPNGAPHRTCRLIDCHQDTSRSLGDTESQSKHHPADPIPTLRKAIAENDMMLVREALRELERAPASESKSVSRQIDDVMDAGRAAAETVKSWPQWKQDLSRDPKAHAPVTESKSVGRTFEQRVADAEAEIAAWPEWKKAAANRVFLGEADPVTLRHHCVKRVDQMQITLTELDVPETTFENLIVGQIFLLAGDKGLHSARLYMKVLHSDGTFSAVDLSTGWTQKPDWDHPLKPVEVKTPKEDPTDEEKATECRSIADTPDFYTEQFPPGFYFDAYMGEGIGALRLCDSQMKVADDVDVGMAAALAWSIVMPSLDRLAKHFRVGPTECSSGNKKDIR